MMTQRHQIIFKCKQTNVKTLAQHFLPMPSLCRLVVRGHYTLLSFTPASMALAHETLRDRCKNTTTSSPLLHND